MELGWGSLRFVFQIPGWLSGPPRQLRVSDFFEICLERDNIQAGDHLEVAHIEGGHLEAQLESRYSDGQVFEGEDDAFCRLLALDASDAASDLQRYGIDRNITAQLLDERQSQRGTLWPRRSAATTMLESRISPTPADSRACGCG